MGLKASSPRAFNWLDLTVPPANGSASYKHWGMDDADSSFEPNNKLGSELCGVGNWSQVYGQPSAWGWSDTKCNGQFPPMCRLLRKWRWGCCAGAALRTAAASAWPRAPLLTASGNLRLCASSARWSLDCLRHAHPPRAAALAPLKLYNSSISKGSQFLWNTLPMNFSAAQQYCNDQGGHLASFVSLPEQRDVEQYLINQGLLLPTFHTAYWIGLQSDVWPRFYWLDNITPSPDTFGAYKHWGAFMQGGKNVTEPNNLAGSETCAAGNLTQSYGQASGWADADCNIKLPFMCKIRRKRPLRLELALTCSPFAILALTPPEPGTARSSQHPVVAGEELQLRCLHPLQSRRSSASPSTRPTPPISSTRP